MPSLSKWLTNQPTTPAHIPTDTIIPLHSHDDTPQNRRISVSYTMHFPCTLSAQTLASALWTLLEKPGWRKLGARLRLNTTNNRLEYHIPSRYTAECPPVNFSQVKYDMCVKEHPIGKKIPVAREGEELQVFDVVDSLQGLLEGGHGIRVLADWIYSDKAQLGLHVVKFEDATLVTLTWMHSLLDAMGRQALLRAWQAVLEGRDGDVPEFWGYDFDPLEKLGAPQGNEADDEPKTVPTKVRTPGTSMISNIMSFFARLLDFKAAFLYLSSLFYTPPSPPYGGRMLCMPPAYLARLRTQALADLSSLDPAQITYGTSTSQPFLSDGDILCAWLTRLIVTSNSRLLSTPNRPVNVINVLGMRDILSTSLGTYQALIPKGKAYIGNCTSGIVSPFTVGEVVDMPLGHVAARVRKDLVKQSGREAVEAGQSAQKEQSVKPSKPKRSEMSPSAFVFTNWAKAKLFEIDFSAAIVGGGGESGSGKPSYIHVHGTDVRGMSGAGVGNVIGKDGKGNYWIGGVLAKEDVEAFRDALEQISLG